MFFIRLQGLPKLPNELRKLHWATRGKEAKMWRTMVKMLALKQKPAKPYVYPQITFVRYSSQSCDHDNGIASIKPLLDGLKDAEIIIDDDQEHIMPVQFKWEQAPRRGGFMEIWVAE